MKQIGTDQRTQANYYWTWFFKYSKIMKFWYPKYPYLTIGTTYMRWKFSICAENHYLIPKKLQETKIRGFCYNFGYNHNFFFRYEPTSFSHSKLRHYVSRKVKLNVLVQRKKFYDYFLFGFGILQISYSYWSWKNHKESYILFYSHKLS